MNRPEERLQRALVAYLRAALPAPWFFFHPPNGGGRSKAEAGVLKALGTMPGLPDLWVVGAHPPFVIPRIVCLEVKSPTGRLSPAQRDAILALERCGIPTTVVRSVAEADAALRAAGVPLKGRAMA